MIHIFTVHPATIFVESDYGLYAEETSWANKVGRDGPTKTIGILKLRHRSLLIFRLFAQSHELDRLEANKFSYCLKSKNYLHHLYTVTMI